MLLRRGASLAALALLLVAAKPAFGASLDFACVSNDSPTDCAIGAAQVRVEVIDAGASLVLFEFHNDGPAESSITDVYFDDGTLLAIAAIVDSPGVAFSQFASPGDLPGGNDASPPFVTTAGFSADSDPAVQPNGVNPGEVLGIQFELQAGRTHQDVLDDLASGALRVGVHVQGFASGGSESLVNAPVPEPSVLWLAGLALAGAAAQRARRR